MTGAIQPVRTIAAVLAPLVCLTGLACGLAPAPVHGATRTPADGTPIATSFIYPVGSENAQPAWDPNNPNGYYVTQGFNTSCDPSAGQGYYLYGLYYCGHTGVDLATSTADAAIHATAAGVVVEAGYNGGGYGVMVRIRHLLPIRQPGLFPVRAHGLRQPGSLRRGDRHSGPGRSAWSGPPASPPGRTCTSRSSRRTRTDSATHSGTPA